MEIIKDEDRIKFKSSEMAAERDKAVFQKYYSGEYTDVKGAIEISFNNDIRITPEQFVKNANWLGYRRKK